MPRESDYMVDQIGWQRFAVVHRRSRRRMPNTANEAAHARKWLVDLVPTLNEHGTLRCGGAVYTASGRLVVSHNGLVGWPPYRKSVLQLRNPDKFIQKAKERCLLTTKCC